MVNPPMQAQAPSEPLVSVIIPTHNRAELLERALRSVLAQTYANLEVVVVDDASADDTRSLLTRLGVAGLSYVRHEVARGGSAARNTGIRIARGRYIAFLDDDDEWEPEKIRRQVPLLDRYDAILCMYSMDGRAIKGGGGVSVGLEELRRGFVRGGSASALIVKAEIAKELLFDDTLPRCQDWDFCIRLAQRYTLGCLDEALVRYNDGAHARVSNAVTTLPAAAIEQRYRMLEKHRSFFGEKWYKRHMARFLLYALRSRSDAPALLWHAGSRYGFFNVARVLGRQLWALIVVSVVSAAPRPAAGVQSSVAGTASKALVSVIIPTYRRCGIVARAIASVQNQTYQHVEIIVVDDGSPDDTASVVRGVDDSRVRYIRHDVNRGLPATRNTGVSAAQGDYIAFLDDDDEWRADKLEKQLAAIKDSDAVLCGALVNGSTLKSYRRTAVALADLRRDNGFDPSGLLVRAHVLRDLTFDEKLRQGEDWDAFIRIAQKYRIAYVPEPLVLYNDGAHERMTSSAKHLSGVELEKRVAILHKHRDFFGERWFRYHVARTLLSYVGSRSNKFNCVRYAVKRCGVLPVLGVLMYKFWSRISAQTMVELARPHKRV